MGHLDGDIESNGSFLYPEIVYVIGDIISKFQFCRISGDFFDFLHSSSIRRFGGQKKRLCFSNKCRLSLFQFIYNF